ncbi:T9SS type B sorting domain-containing protein [Capnocytophaga bilenii]
MKRNLLTVILLIISTLGVMEYAVGQTLPKASILRQVGCGTGTDAGKAEVIVTVDQDNTSNYTYNFGNGYSSSNRAWLAPGTRTIAVRRNDNKQYSVTITIPGRTATPTITPAITYNCNGTTADVRLINDQGTYNYTYVYNGQPQSNPYFRNLTVGQQHTITVKYTPSATEKTIVFYDDFGTYNGETAKSSFSPYVNKNVFFDPLDGSGVQRRASDGATRTNGIGTDSAYCIAQRDHVLQGIPTVDLPNPIPTWLVPEDKDKVANGKFLWYNVEHSAGDKFIVYQRKSFVKSNAFFDFRASVYNPVYEHATNNPYTDMEPIMQLLVYANEADAAANVNPLYKSYELQVPKATKKDDWYTLDLSGYTGSNTELVFVIRMFNDTLGPDKALGNDVALDNILVTQPSDTCENSMDVAVNVASNTNTFSTTISYATCNATTGIITVNASDTTNYDYTYSLDGQAAQTNKVFNGVAVGVHTITIKATPKGAKTLFKEDFGSGASYSLPRSVVPTPFVYRPDGAGYPGDVLQEGDYRVANHDNLIKMPSWGWKPVKSHGDNSNTGRFLAFNYGANANRTFYQQDIQVEPNKLVTLEYYALNIDAPSNLPNIRAVFINKATNATITTYDSGGLTGRTSATYNPTDWQKITCTFNPGSATTIQLRFTNLNNNTGSNDFAIDDILVTQAYEACTTTLTTTVTAQITRAFAGVTKLIGCGTGANADKAEVQVTNVVGNGNYEYQFGTGSTWQTSNTSWLPAGSHTVLVRNANAMGCAYTMTVVVPAKSEPVVKTEVFYGCEGKPTLQVGVQSPVNELTYLYKLDNGAFTATSVFENISSGTHTVTVKYKEKEALTPVTIFKEDFGSGPAICPSAEVTSWTCQIGYLHDDKAAITNSNQLLIVSGWPWTVPQDRSSSGYDANGRYFAINYGGMFNGKPFYTRTIEGIDTTKKVHFEFYAFNLINRVATTYPNIDVIFEDTSGNHIYTYNTGNITKSTAVWDWRGFSFSFDPLGHTKLVVKFKDRTEAHGDDDFAIDDIYAYQMFETKGCEQEVRTTTAAIVPNLLPSLTVSATYNCTNNTADIAIIGTPTATYKFVQYTKQGSTPQVSNAFSNLSLGTYTFTVDYQSAKGATFTVLYEDFGAGTEAVTSPYTGKNLYFSNQKNESYIAVNGDGNGRKHTPNTILEEYEYTIVKALFPVSSSWNAPIDRSGNTNGRKLFVNPTTMTQQDLYLRQVSVLPNTSLKFSAQFFNLLKVAGGDPIVQLAIYDKEGGNLISQTAPYAVPHSTTGNDWHQQVLTLTDSQVGARNTLYVVVRMLNTVPGGHDMAMDDILVTQNLATCSATITATVSSGVTRAFAGVTKLIGCGTGLNANKAEVQVTNIEGGVAPYEYQFGTGASWVASNTGWLDAGTHTVSVRNAGTVGCVYSMSVTVPTALAAPVIKTEVFYGCDGKPTLQVGVQSPVNELTYLYKLDSGAFTTTSVFANVSSGTHQMSVKYEYRDTPSPMVLWREDFGTGDPAPNSSVNATDFTYKDPRVDNLWAVGRYTVAGYKDLIAPTPFGTSRMPFYHPTTAPNAIFREPPKGTTTGAPDDRILYVDMASAYVGKVFMEKEVDIHPTNLIEFGYQIQNANGPNALPRKLEEPNMQIKIVDANNPSNVLGTISSGKIPNDGQWHLVSSKSLGAINPNGVRRVKIQFINIEPDSWGNDFYLDDITVYQTPAACGQVVSSTLNVTDNPVGVASFTAAQLGCGTTNGTVVVTASPTTGYIYTYTLQGGGTATSVNTFANLSFGTHTFTINYAPVTNTLVLLNEDFGEGTDAVKSPYVGKNLYFNENTLSAYTAYNANKQSINHLANTALMVGEYTIASNMVKLSYDWTVPTDRSGKANGRKLFIDGIVSVPEQEVYTREVSIAPNLPLTFTTDFYNLVHNSSVPSANNPRVNIALYESEASYKNGSVPLAQSPIEELLSVHVHNQWKTHTLTLTAGDVGTRTRIYAVVKMHNVINHGHDLAVDNIRITQFIGCEATVTATVLPGVTRAFAGVTQLIGCGTEENADKAQVRVSNVEGGTTPYEYQFGTGEAWVTTNTMWLEAGTYTVSVRSNGGLGCVFSTKLVVPARLATPTLSMDVHYDCEGKGILTLGVVDADPNLQYWFSLNGSAYTTTYMFTGLTSGTHLVSVKYDYITSPQPVLLFKDDFGNGAPTALPGPASDYGLTYGTTYPIGAGFYQIVSQAQAPSYWKLVTPFNTCAIRTGDPLYDRWVSVYDHTSSGTDPTGRFYMSDFRGTQADGDLFYKREVSVLPGSDINYEFYALNLFRNDHTTSPWGHGEALKPNVVVRLVAPNGTVVASTTTGEIPNSVCATNLADNLNNWRKYEGKLNVGTYTKLTVEIRSVGSAPHGWGNDMALDDITVNMIPKSCGQYYTTDKDVVALERVLPQFTVSRTIDCVTGKGGFVVTPTLTTGYTYTYTLGSTTYTGTVATFTGLSFSDTTHTITIAYQTSSKTITVLKEDFGTGTGAVKNAYVGKDLYFNDNTTGAYTAYNGRGQSRAHVAGAVLAVDEYTVVNALSLLTPDWRSPSDKSGDANGRKLYVDGSASAIKQDIYTRKLSVRPNTALTFTADFYNLVQADLVAPANNTAANYPQVQLQLYESETAYNAPGATPIHSDNIYAVTPATSLNDWRTRSITLTDTQVGGRTELYAVVRMHNVINAGHDLAVDNIIVTQELPACVVTLTATLTNEGLRTPTLSVPADIDILCTSATATTAVANWIAQATATDTNCDVAATVTATYTYTGSLCNAGSVTVTFTATGTFGNITTKTAVINFIKTPLVVTPTLLQIPDNIAGGTTSSVIPNITLGGVTSPSVNSVTITFSGLPSGVTSTTGGRLVVAPNTPAGVHSISYMVCEVANSNNCKTVTATLIIGAATPTVGANTFTATTNTRTVIPGVIGNILTGATVGTRTATAGVGGNVSITLTHTPTTPNAPQIDPATGSVTVSSNTPAGVYTIGYQLCSSPIHCQAAVATITVPQIKPYIPAATITHSGTATTTRNVLDGGTVNGGSQSATVTGANPTVQITVTSSPTGSVVPRLDPSTGIVTVPPTTPNGVYTISYNICTTATPTSCVSRTTTIVVGNVTPTVTPDDVTASVTTSGVVPGVIGNILTNDNIGGASVTTNEVTIRVTHTPTTPNAPVLHPATGSVTVSGNTPAGVYTISYEVCNGANCATGTVTVTVPQLLPNVPNVSITHSGTATTTRNVLDGGTVNGGSQSATVTGANPTVQITVTSSPTGSVVPRLDPSTGIVTVPPTTPNGVYTISYNICTTATPTSCVSRTTTIIVGNVTPTVTPDDVTASVTTNSVVPGTIGNILTNDTIGGASVTTNEVTIRVTHTPTTPNAPVLHPATGSVTVSGNTPAGVYTISYEVCNGANCATGTVTVTVPQLLPNVPNVSITHSGTATTTGNVLAGGTVNGGSQSATVTGANPTVRITITSSPTGSVVPRLDPSTGIVTVPPATPNGVYTISYSVCTTATPTSCVSRTTVIAVGNSSATTTTPTVTPDDVTASVTTNNVVPGTIGNILTNDTIGGASVTTNEVTIRVTHTPTTPNAPVLHPATGSVTVSGNTPAGVYTISYEVCNGANCATGTVTVTVPQLLPNVPNVSITHSGTATTTRNVLDGGTVNGGSQSATVTGANPTVQITVTSSPTGSVVPRLDPSTGIVTVPPTTPNGVYTISYNICTTATPTSCVSRTTTIVVGNVTPTVTPDDVTASVTTSGVVPGVIGNILTNDNIGGASVTTNEVTIRVTHTPTTPNAPVLHPATGSVTVSGNTPAGVYTISYEVCNGANCATGTVTVTVPQLLPNVPNVSITHSGTATTTRNVLDGGTVNGGSQSATVTGANPTVQITVTSSPTGSVVPRLDPSTGIVTVPPTTPNGVYTISYSICTTATPTSCVSRTTVITVGNSSATTTTPTIVITPDSFVVSSTSTRTTPSVFDNDRIVDANGNTHSVTSSTVTISTQTVTTNASGNTVTPTINPDGTITIPEGLRPGNYTITYQLCTTTTPTTCANGTVTFTVVPTQPTVIVNPDSFVVTGTGTRTTPSVFDNDHILHPNGSTTAVNSSTVTISTQSVTTNASGNTVTPTINPDGTITIPEGLRPGNYTITYQLCTTASPSTCTTGEVNFDVPDNEVPDAHTITATTFINTPVEIKVTDKPATHVNVITPPANGIATNNGDGTITYEPNNGFVGTDEFEYTLCTAGGCSTATVRITVTADLIIYNGVSLNGSALNNHFHIGGIEAYPNNTVRIYNRWGAEVFSAEGYDNLTKVFNGRSNARATMDAGDHLPQGTYYYIIEYYDAANERHKEVGWLYLKK